MLNETAREMMGLGETQMHSGFDFFGLASRIGRYGGQSLSSRSRCFVSSLSEMAYGFSVFSYGGCYESNCATPKHLQVAINGWLGK